MSFAVDIELKSDPELLVLCFQWLSFVRQKKYIRKQDIEDSVFQLVIKLWFSWFVNDTSDLFLWNLYKRVAYELF